MESEDIRIYCSNRNKLTVWWTVKFLRNGRKVKIRDTSTKRKWKRWNITETNSSIFGMVTSENAYFYLEATRENENFDLVITEGQPLSPQNVTAKDPRLFTMFKSSKGDDNSIYFQNGFSEHYVREQNSTLVLVDNKEQATGFNFTYD